MSANIFSDKQLAPMGDLHKELEHVVPGSQEEREILERGRDRRGQKSDEITVSRAADLLATAPDDRQVIKKDPARRAAHRAIEEVTGEHRIPVIVPEHPDTLH